MAATTARVAMGAGGGGDLARRLLGRRSPPLFVDMGRRGRARVLEWVKPYRSGVDVPAGHKVPAIYADPGSSNGVTFRILTDAAHQGTGQLAVAERTVEMEALTLSRASVLMGVLAATLGSPLAVTSVDWERALPAALGATPHA
jgi:hypothetical protein